MNATMLFTDRLPSRPVRRENLPSAARGNIVRLRADQHLQLHGALGSAVHAIDGAVWITQDGDIRDIVLEAGQSFVIDRPSDTLLTPLDRAAVRIDAAPSQRPFGRQMQPVLAAARTLFA
jgi:archaeosine-15-forming tRNA-guanine transglycosylase